VYLSGNVLEQRPTGDNIRTGVYIKCTQNAWLSMAGASSQGLPNGRPIDEWGIRMEKG